MSDEPIDGAMAAFLADLTELTRRHGLVIGGCGCCGCCGSPFVTPEKSDATLVRIDAEGARYVMEDASLVWDDKA